MERMKNYVKEIKSLMEENYNLEQIYEKLRESPNRPPKKFQYPVIKAIMKSERGAL